MVSAVATEEPQTAPKRAEAKIEAIESEPRVPRRTALPALKRSDDRPAEAATAPISVNSGTTENEYACASSIGAEPAVRLARWMPSISP